MAKDALIHMIGGAVKAAGWELEAPEGPQHQKSEIYQARKEILRQAKDLEVNTMRLLSPEDLGFLHDGELARLISTKETLELHVILHNGQNAFVRAEGVLLFLASGILNYAVIDNVSMIQINTSNFSQAIDFINKSKHPVSSRYITDIVSNACVGEFALISIETSTQLNIDILASKIELSEK